MDKKIEFIVLNFLSNSSIIDDNVNASNYFYNLTNDIYQSKFHKFCYYHLNYKKSDHNESDFR